MGERERMPAKKVTERRARGFELYLRLFCQSACPQHAGKDRGHLRIAAPKDGTK